jgi:hypothetical protein
MIAINAWPARKVEQKLDTYTIHFEELDIKLTKEAALALLETLTEALEEKK